MVSCDIQNKKTTTSMDTQIFICNHFLVEEIGCSVENTPKDADRMANSADFDQSAPMRATISLNHSKNLKWSVVKVEIKYF